MDINLYSLEVITKARLADLRAASARRALLASLRQPQSSIWTTVRDALLLSWRRTSRRKIVSPRPA